jgi:hypothetical protein
MIYYIFCALLVSYLIWKRVIQMYIAHLHYTRQTTMFKPMAFPLPFLGHIPYILMHDDHPFILPLVKWIEVALGGKNFN